ncbi:MAG: hypothetical protein ACK5EA_13440, partial [Planctomycetaceae bacterium]
HPGDLITIGKTLRYRVPGSKNRREGAARASRRVAKAAWLGIVLGLLALAVAAWFLLGSTGFVPASTPSPGNSDSVPR